MKKPPKDEVKSETAEAGEVADLIWQIHADGIDEEVRETAEEWLNASNGDALIALLLVTERMIVVSRHASLGMDRGRLPVRPHIGAKS
jgi:hypothetical protein